MYTLCSNKSVLSPGLDAIQSLRSLTIEVGGRFTSKDIQLVNSPFKNVSHLKVFDPCQRIEGPGQETGCMISHLDLNRNRNIDD